MSKIGSLRNLLVALLHEHVRDGTIPTNARFLYYELVQRGELMKERTGARRPDQDLHTALTNIRDDARIPWEWIVDETLGDLDLVGDQIEDHTKAVLEREIDGALDWERLALTQDQVRQYDLPVITKRDRRYRDGRGVHEAVETEAISQAVLIEILKARLEELLPEPLSRVHGRESRQRRKVAALLNRGS